MTSGQRPHDILFAPDGRVWVTDWGGPVHVFDRRGRLHGKVELAEESHHLAFTPDGQEGWITDHGAKRIFIVDARRLKAIGSLRLPGGPHHVAISADGALAAVADHEGGTLVVYDVERRSRVRTVRVGAGPHGVARQGVVSTTQEATRACYSYPPFRPWAHRAAVARGILRRMGFEDDLANERIDVRLAEARAPGHFVDSIHRLGDVVSSARGPLRPVRWAGGAGGAW